MDLRQLKYFVAVIENKSLSAASAHLRIAQPAVSRSLKHLAEGLGVSILERHGRGMRPTEAGERLYIRAQRLLLDVEALENDIVATDESPAGHVICACPPAVGSLVIPPTLSALRERYPNIKVSVREGFSDTVYKWLLTGECDIAVVSSPRPTPLIKIWKSWPQQMRVGVPMEGRAGRFGNLVKPSYSLADITRLPLILPLRESSHRMVVEAAVVAENGALKVAYEVDGISTIIQLVAHGLGFTVLMETAMIQAVEMGLIRSVAFTPPGISGEIAIAAPTARQPSRATREFSKLLQVSINELILGLGGD
jgi:LysR family nitrogen assimilation transcriptional regulator